MKWLKENIWWLCIPIGLAVAFIFGGLSVYIYNDIMDDETIVIEGKIVDVNLLETPPGYLSHVDGLELIFEDGTSYLVVSSKDIDFTVNSEFIIKLWRDDASEKYWSIERMYKVPS